MVPVEAVERRQLAERGPPGAARQVALVALAPLEGDELLERLHWRGARLGEVSDERTDGVGRGAQPERAQGIEDVVVTWHRRSPGREG